MQMRRSKRRQMIHSLFDKPSIIFHSFHLFTFHFDINLTMYYFIVFLIIEINLGSVHTNPSFLTAKTLKFICSSLIVVRSINFPSLLMSDNIPKDLCKKQITAYLDIPTEIWTDVFMLLPRRTLVQRVQPVNKVFKAICDRNVKSVHVIGDIGDISDFVWKLGQKRGLVQRQLEALKGHDGPLANHFRMTNVQIQIYYNGGIEAKLAVFRHSLDLFHCCQLIISPQYHMLRSQAELEEHCQAYLAILEPAKPSYIEMNLEEMDLTNLRELFRHPTTLNCPRLNLSGSRSAWASRQAIFDWLHHRVDDVEHDEKMRCLILQLNSAVLVEPCVQNFKQSKVPEDRRSFVLTFWCIPWDVNALDNFEHKNPATGEVLLFERVLREDGQPTSECRLLRCMASQIANNNGKVQLYAKLFKSTFEFNLEQKNVAKVEIF